MSNDNQMFNDLVEIFDEEYDKRRLITPQNTAEKLIAKGYRKASEVVRKIFEKIEGRIYSIASAFEELKVIDIDDIAELKEEILGEWE